MSKLPAYATLEEAAQAIEAEGRLIQYTVFNDNGERCARGVLMDFTFEDSLFIPRRDRAHNCMCVVTINDNFEGTPEERCVHVAAWIRSQGNV